MRSFAKVDFIKSNGCATKIIDELNGIPHITNIKVNIEERLVSFLCSSEHGRLVAAKILRGFNSNEALAEC